tara:strand:+ start:347 stop:529 length:183 start_codon:yes stop_codon:yes gene_type:complete
VHSLSHDLESFLQQLVFEQLVLEQLEEQLPTTEQELRNKPKLNTIIKYNTLFFIDNSLFT